jgi:uncharacterized protein
VTAVADSGIRQRLQLALREAMRARDTIAVSAVRSALAAIDNAGAVPPAPAPAPGSGGPHFAGAAPGLGAGEAERRTLTEAQAEQLVRAEVTERQAAARDYDRTGHPHPAARLRREADVLTAALNRTSPPPAP